jgi:hypothetical protein
MEIVKIRMQMQKKQEGGPRLGALGVARELGLRGLYTGGKATLLRYFPIHTFYSHSHPLSLLFSHLLILLSLIQSLIRSHTHSLLHAYRYIYSY